VRGTWGCGRATASGLRSQYLDPSELGISIQFDLVPRSSPGGGVPTVEGLSITDERDVFFALGFRLWPNRGEKGGQRGHFKGEAPGRDQSSRRSPVERLLRMQSMQEDN
jgi:hypothetical protein